MKIIEAISKIDSQMHNTYNQSDKLGWLSTLDGLVANIINAYEGDPVIFTGYNAKTDLSMELLAQAPYDAMYLRWLEAQIHYNNGEYDKYNNAIDTFTTDLKGFKNYYNRTHMPKGKKFKYF